MHLERPPLAELLKHLMLGSEELGALETIVNRVFFPQVTSPGPPRTVLPSTAAPVTASTEVDSSSEEDSLPLKMKFQILPAAESPSFSDTLLVNPLNAEDRSPDTPEAPAVATPSLALFRISLLYRAVPFSSGSSTTTLPFWSVPRVTTQ